MMALSPLFALLLVRLWLPASVFEAGCPLRDRLRASGPEGSSLCQYRQPIELEDGGCVTSLKFAPGWEAVGAGF